MIPASSSCCHRHAACSRAFFFPVLVHALRSLSGCACDGAWAASDCRAARQRSHDGPLTASGGCVTLGLVPMLLSVLSVARACVSTRHCLIFGGSLRCSRPLAAQSLTSHLNEYHVVGRRRPSPTNQNPTILRMSIFAKSSVEAKNKFFCTSRVWPSVY